MVKYLCTLIGLIFILSSLTSCVTLPQNDFLNYQPVQNTNEQCVDIDIYTYDNSFSLSKKEPTKENKTEVDKFKKELIRYNIITTCKVPLRVYKLVTDFKMNYPIIKIPWIVLSTLSFGIIPYFDTYIYEISLQDGDRLVAKEAILIDKAIWIFYLPKAYSLEQKANELYGTSVDRAIFSKRISEIIKNDLN